MSPEPEVTNGELMRALAQLRDDMNRRFAESKNVSFEVFQEFRQGNEDYRRVAGERMGGIEKDVAEIQGSAKQNLRLVLASFVFPVLVALAVAALLARGGGA